MVGLLLEKEPDRLLKLVMLVTTPARMRMRDSLKVNLTDRVILSVI